MKFKRLFAAIISLLLLQNSIAQLTGKNDTVHLRVQRLDDSYIDAYLKYPATAQKVPLLIMCQGSGCGSMSAPFLAVTEKYKNQLARIVIEKPGIKYGDDGKVIPTSYKEDNAVYNRLYDYLRVLAYLRAKAGWWNGEILVIGGSEGGLLAGMLASFYPGTKGLAIFGFGGGLTFGEAWPIATEQQKKSEGLGEMEIKKAALTVKDTFKMIMQNPTPYTSFEGEDNTYKWWASIIGLRLSNILTDLSIPIYIAHGSGDMMMPVISARRLQEEFTKQGKSNLQYREFMGYNHGFADSTGKSHYAEVFVEAIDWMLAHK